MATMSKQYDPQAVEQSIYQKWEEAGAFKPEAKATETFTISMPPPNATGQLHLGHAIMLAVEDILIRHARMQGKAALWVPGTDHAAIATESVVIKKLQAEGMARPREALGREGLLAAIRSYVEGSRATIRNQVRRMGSSCDWSRERYTLDKALNRCVNEVFAKMVVDGLLYRGSRIVNWDPNMQTTVSDDEMERVEAEASFYTFKFGPFEIATARPETKFGDKYVVMHPEDERYAAFKAGDTFACEWLNGQITATVIKDEAIDPDFGTGVMTITPWHDATDFEIAQRHGLESVQVIDLEGKLLPIAGAFAGRDRIEARVDIVQKLKEKGLLVKVDGDYLHSISLNYRGKGVIEPQIMPQWFIDVNKKVRWGDGIRSEKVSPWAGRELSLKEVLQEAVQEKLIKILPERFEKTYFHWIDNLRDWCVSRQIWWGHRIPAWYRKSVLAGDEALPLTMRLPRELGSADLYVGVTPPEDEAAWVQDPDTLDTWFSSALWTWSTLIDADKAEDFSLSLEDLMHASTDFMRFHPTQVMETGYDILFFWVARMIMMTTYNTGEIPFETVYLHGLVRTRDGSKMSKSNPDSVIDPLDMIDKYGTDALRLALVIGTTPGNDTRLYEEKIAGYRNFCNKLWNAARFVLDSKEEEFYEKISFAEVNQHKFDTFQKAIIKQAYYLLQEIDDHLGSYNIGQAAESLYSFVWSDFCDWFIERQKEELNSDDQGRINRSYFVLVYVLHLILKMLQPFTPFITEEIWGKLRERLRDIPKDEQKWRSFSFQEDMLIAVKWPVAEGTSRVSSVESDFMSFLSHPFTNPVGDGEALTDIDELWQKFQDVEDMKKLITEIRSIKANINANVTQGEIIVSSMTKAHRQILLENVNFIPAAIGLKTTAQVVDSLPSNLSDDFIKITVGGIEAAVRFDTAIDEGARQAKLQKDLATIQQGIANLEKLLGNEAFIAKAPEQVVQSERDKLLVLKDQEQLLTVQLGNHV